MDDLQGRFRRLDRVPTPNLWNEAVARAVELELAPRRTFTPGFALIAMALLLAALGGTVAVGAWLDRQSPGPEIVTYDNGMIVTHEGCGRLVALDPTTREVRELVAASTGCNVGDGTGLLRPAWSADGSRLAYLVPATRSMDETPGVTGILVYDAATGESRQVDECPVQSCDGIDISPDGSLVAYVTAPSDDSPGSLVVVDVDTRVTYRIDFAAQLNRGGPAFSPDGARIALPLVGGQSGVHVVDVRAMQEGAVGGTTLLHGMVDADDVAWSPDGEWIAFTKTSWVYTGIVVVRADGTDSRILANGPDGEGAMFPTWSADSASVAYLTAPTEGGALDGGISLELWTVAIDGGEPTRIFESGCCVASFGRPEWSPDGEWIAFGAGMQGRDSEAGVVLLKPDGSEVQSAPGMPLEPAWQPIPED